MHSTGYTKCSIGFFKLKVQFTCLRCHAHLSYDTTINTSFVVSPLWVEERARLARDGYRNNQKPPATAAR